ncbi:MAG: type II toxin-antitoxin system RelE/ParE family toxin [Candidatus Eremiobacteraeota bacterium]|nr:type II toxin-antitoxin system RelE/ParE family toxin [Candidatus Eremiobacteraeota bacterium]
MRYSPNAERDLNDIWAVCAENRSAEAATRLIKGIVDSLQTTLVVFPNGGRARPELGRSIRSFPVPPYVALYRVIGRRVEIVRVLHGHRDIQRALLSLLIA